MQKDLPESILQFGTGKFLRCFADLFAEEANGTEQPVGRVVVLQSTGNARVRQLRARGCRYHVAIRGLQHGERTDRVEVVQSISRALATSEDWQEVLQVARSSVLRAVVSNTTEAGFRLEDDDPPGASPPRSFPAKLLAVLQARHESGRPGLVILPCELLDDNADRLLELVLEQAARWRVSEDTVAWLRSECRWHNTLVDRIVSAPGADDPLATDDPLYAVAEPFALWLVEGLVESAVALPGLASHPSVQTVERLEPYCLRKVRILNGAHTALVAKAMPLGFQTVRQAVLDKDVGSWLESLLFGEIVPALEGRTDDPEQFARETLERFANPFLEHRLADIALHHEVKRQTRLVPTRDEYRRRFGRMPRLLDDLLGSS
ncbi:MAG: hypothetical protein JXB62_12855 [Pirellulales bacterium]|nr:hypothetical protein [Pirellulales bacterium]